jgi:hypothetical protein
MEKLEKELEERQEAKADVEAIQEVIEGITSFSIVDNKKFYIGGEAQRKEKQETRKEQENISKMRAERHNLYLVSTTGSASVMSEKDEGVSEKVDFPKQSVWGTLLRFVSLLV